tara:strand:- start:234 stop:455 length:222 start_codon:yes stop_codon:yes gene_type:complete
MANYIFSDIPNTETGKRFIEELKKYFNHDTYRMRCRGQYLDNDKLPEGKTWRNFSDGQPIKYSKSIRVYIDRK